MARFRHAWFLLFAAAVLVIACGSYSAAIAMDHTGCGEHAGKSGTMVNCGTSCMAVAPVAAAQPTALPAAVMIFESMHSMFAGTSSAPDPPPPRAQKQASIFSGVSS
jgi:hypothetical protein